MSQPAGRIVNSLCYGTILVWLALATTPALAAGKQSKERGGQDRAAKEAKERMAEERAAKERAARTACLSGDYIKGVAILSELFVDSKDPTHLFNQGRCFEQTRRYDDAIARFDEYLRVAQGKMAAEDREAAEKHRSDCRTKLAEERAIATASQIVPGTATTPLSNAETSPGPGTSIVVTPTPPPSPTPGRRGGLLTAGIVTGGLGVAAIVAGVVLNLKANSMVDSMEGGVGTYSSAKEDEQKTYRTLAWVGYGAGAACVVAGAVLIGFGMKPSASSSTHVALVPSIGPGQAGAMLTGGF